MLHFKHHLNLLSLWEILVDNNSVLKHLILDMEPGKITMAMASFYDINEAEGAFTICQLRVHHIWRRSDFWLLVTRDRGQNLSNSCDTTYQWPLGIILLKASALIIMPLWLDHCVSIKINEYLQALSNIIKAYNVKGFSDVSIASDVVEGICQL